MHCKRCDVTFVFVVEEFFVLFSEVFLKENIKKMIQKYCFSLDYFFQYEVS